MGEAIVVALITGGLSLAGVVVTCLTTAKKNEAAMKITQAVTETKLEELTSSYPGVEKAYAIQAGREVRIMVTPDKVSDEKMIVVAREIAKKIEDEMDYPGQIKVTIIRETRSVEYAN